MEAGVVGRGALAATLFSRAETLASQLHDDTCLVPAWLRYRRAVTLFLQADLMTKATKGGQEKSQEGRKLLHIVRRRGSSCKASAR